MYCRGVCAFGKMNFMVISSNRSLRAFVVAGLICLTLSTLSCSKQTEATASEAKSEKQVMAKPIEAKAKAMPSELKTDAPSQEVSPVKHAPDPETISEEQLRKEAEIFDALDLTRPELAEVAAAWAKKNHTAARKAFAAYLRSRKNVNWQKWTTPEMPRDLNPKIQESADLAAEGKLQGGLVKLVYPFPNGDVDWRFDATTEVPGNAPNHEWTWQLNRMSFWVDMALAYRASKDEKYPKAFIKQMHAWIKQCPIPSRAENGPRSPWRTIEAGIRPAWNWPAPLFGFLHSPSMSDFDLVAFVGAFMDHANYLHTFHTRLNWLTMEMNGLYSVGVLFPEFKNAKEWRNYAVTRLAEEAQSQFLADGAHKELSTGYQNVAIDNIARIPEVAQWNNLMSELPPTYMTPLEKAYEWQMNLSLPDRGLPKMNDSWPTNVPAVLKKALVFFPNRADFKWFASKGAEGTPPAKTSMFLDWSGLAAMRSGWEPDANYLFYRPGPIGAGHCHQDALTINVASYGRLLIFSSEGGSYEKSKWRDWAVSSYAQNVVIVDGLAQCRPLSNDPMKDPNMVAQKPLDAKWESTPVYDFATGIYDQGYAKGNQGVWKKETQRLFVTHQRDVLFLKPDMFIVADRLTPQDAAAHSYQARWHMYPTNTKIDPETKILVTTDADKPNLAIVPLLAKGLNVTSATAQEEPEILGWDVRKDLVPPRTPTTTLLHTVSGEGAQYLLTLFIPLKAGEANPVSKVEAGSAKNSAKVVFSDGRSLLITMHEGLGISAQETLANGQAGRVAKGGVK